MLKSDFSKTQLTRIFGRDAVWERLYQKMGGLQSGYRQNVALLGPTGSGKSMLLEQLHRISEDLNLLTIPFQTQLESFHSFAERFVQSLLFSALDKKGIATETTLKALLAHSKKIFPMTCQASQQVLGKLEREPAKAFSELFDLPNQLHRESGWYLVLMIDEFDRLENDQIRDPFVEFGKKMMVHRGVMYLVTSSQPQKAHYILREKLDLLFGQFEVIQIEGLDPKGAYEMIDFYTAGHELDITLKKFLTYITGGSPLYLKQILMHLTRHEKHPPSTKSPIPTERIIEALEKELFHPQGYLNQHFQHQLGQFSDPRSQSLSVTILQALSTKAYTCSEITKQLGRSRRDISKLLQRLVGLDLAVQNGQCYFIENSLFRFWLETSYTTQLKSVYLDHQKNAISFRLKVQEKINVFTAEDKKGMVQRVAELFALFNHETIQIGEQKRQLPRFSEIKTATDSPNGTLPIYAQNGKGFWIGHITNGHMKENEVSHFAEHCKKSGLDVKRRVIISQKPLDLNARLVAKEEKIWNWDIKALNRLMDLYGKPHVM